MAYLKVYIWEKAMWPWAYEVKLDRMAQEKLLKKLSNRFGTTVPSIGQSYRRGAADGLAGAYFKPNLIKMGKVSTLSTVCHEFAHHLAFHRYQAAHHGRMFKKALKMVYRFIEWDRS